MQFSKIFLSESTRPRAFIFDVQHHLEVLYQYLVDNISGPLEMAPLWPLTFSSGERPRALWALLFVQELTMHAPILNIIIEVCSLQVRTLTSAI